MSKRRQRLATIAASTVLCIVVACGDDRPPAAGNVTGSPPPGGGSTVLPGAADASTNTDAGGDASTSEREPACVGPTLGGSVITARLLVDEDVPGDEGGAVTPGVYDLTDVAVYGIPAGDDGPAVPPDPVPAVRATLTLDANKFEITTQQTPVGASKADPPVARRATYQLSDEVFLATDGICPTGSSVLVPYTATPTTIVIHAGTRRWETFTRR